MKSVHTFFFCFPHSQYRKSDQHSALVILSHLVFLTTKQNQVTYRGYMARIRVKGIREENRRRRAATAIQCMVRFRGARHSSAARNRHKGILTYTRHKNVVESLLCYV